MADDALNTLVNNRKRRDELRQTIADAEAEIATLDEQIAQGIRELVGDDELARIAQAAGITSPKPADPETDRTPAGPNVTVDQVREALKELGEANKSAVARQLSKMRGETIKTTYSRFDAAWKSVIADAEDVEGTSGAGKKYRLP